MPGIISRVQTVIGGILGSSYGPTGTHREQLAIARRQWDAFQPTLTELVEVAVPAMGERLNELGIRWTPGMGVPRG